MNLKRGDKVYILKGSQTGKIVTVENKYSRITGFYTVVYIVRCDKTSYMNYYCEEDAIIKLEDNFLLSILYGYDKEDE